MRRSVPGRLAMLLAVMPALACASLTSRVIAPPESEVRFTRAVAALDRSDFGAAVEDLGWLVSRCEAGARGRTALLLWASSELDLRNPHGSPAAAARLTDAYLRLPWLDEEEVPVARTLHLMALDRMGTAGPGVADTLRVALRDSAAADSTASDSTTSSDSLGADSAAAAALDSMAAAATDPAAAARSVRASDGLPPLAKRFDHCGGGGVAEWSLEPPEHPGTPTADRLERIAVLEAELAARADSLRGALARNAEQVARVRELQAEIERIRRLLRGGSDTLSIGR